tara:strand:+ start:1168 stop:1512 length:345 start_codon:yes stop_codon:yes gene_type:complete
LKNFLNIIPIITGIVTIRNICSAISNIENSKLTEDPIAKLIDVRSVKGIVITHRRLITAVRDIDKATSPLANEVIIFDVAPPGATAISITPIANSGDKGQIETRISPTIGKITI